MSIPSNIKRTQESRPHRGLGLASIVLVFVALVGVLLPSSALAEGYVNKGNFGTSSQPTFTNPAGLAVDPASHDLIVIDSGENKEQQVEIKVASGSVGGTFQLSFDGYSTGWTGTGAVTCNGTSTSITGVTTTTGALAKNEEIKSAPGSCIQPGTLISAVDGAAGTITLSKATETNGNGGTVNLASDLAISVGPEESRISIREALERLPSIGPGNVRMPLGPGTSPPIIRPIELRNRVGTSDGDPGITCNGAGITGTSPTCTVATTIAGAPSGIERFNPDGTPADFSALGTNVIDGKGGGAGPGSGGTCLPVSTECDETPQDGILSTEIAPGHGLGAEFEAQVAVAPPGAAGGTEGDIYVTDAFRHFVDVFAPSGEYIGQRQFGFPCGVATSPTGDLFVGSYEAAKGVYRLIPSGPAQFTQSAGSPLTSSRPKAPCQVAAGAGATGGNIFSVNFGGGILKTVSEGSEEGVSQYEFAAGARVAAVDPVTGYVFEGHSTFPSGTVGVFDASGTSGATEVSRFEVASPVTGIALDPSSQTAYVTREGAKHVEVFSQLILPAATTEPASGIPDLLVTLHGQVSAEGGTDASCVFEYTSLSEFDRNGFAEASSIPCSPGGPFTGTSAEAVEAQLSGLHPGTSYRFRLTASNTGGGATRGETLGFQMPTSAAPPAEALPPCPNEPLRSGAGARLPDCRAFEQATPLDKNGSDAGGAHDLVQAASGGGAVRFYAQTGVPGGRGAQEYPTYVAQRHSSSWLTQGLLPPATYGEGLAASLGTTPDLRYNVTEISKLGVGRALLLEDTRSGEIEVMVPYVAGATARAFAFAGASSDASRVFFESTLPLTGETPAGQDNLYVWERDSSTVRLAGVLAGGSAPAGGAFGGAFNWVEGDEDLSGGGAIKQMYVAAAHAVSSDGDQVYFTAAGTGQLLLRRGLAGGTPTTLAVNESHKTNGSGPGGADPNGPQPAIFAEATASGSRAFFMSREELTNDANTGTTDQGMDLYLYEPDGSSPRLTDLTPDASDPNGAEVQGVLGASADGTVVYFAANGVLAPGAPKGNCDPFTGGNDETVRTCNIYRYDGASTPPTVTFVARVDGTGGAGRGNDLLNWSAASKPPRGTGTSSEKTARVSADGKVLLLSSVLPLTDQENQSDDCQGGVSGHACLEFFRYDSTTESLSCVTCDPTGAAPASAPSFATDYVKVARTPGATPSGVLLRTLSSDGSRAFFQTEEALIPGDFNGVQDVYEWEARGSGSCATGAFEGGCLYLVSSGSGSQPSYFADADDDGANVFFFTGSQLVPADRDELFDIYTARELGGLPTQNEVVSPPCSGEACRTAAPAASVFSSPGSASLFGPGNATPKQQKKKHHKKRHHKKKHHKKKHHKKPHRNANRDHGGGK